MEISLFGGAFALYAIAMSLFFGYVVTRRESLARNANAALVAAAVAHAASIIIRTVMARRLPGHEWYVPWANWFESFSFFALVIAVEYLVIERRRGLPILGAFVSPIVFVMVTVAVHSPFGLEIRELPPALRSHWMAIHVPVMFISYAAFAHAFAVGMAYLIQEGQLKSKHPSLSFRLPSLDELDRLIFGIIGWAFPALTLGLVVGALWAYDAWGRYWNWDPKETWALATWLIYLIYLHMRIVVRWRGRKTAYLSLAGFGFVIFTYVGVNYISRLHGFLGGH